MRRCHNHEVVDQFNAEQEVGILCSVDEVARLRNVNARLVAALSEIARPRTMEGSSLFARNQNSAIALLEGIARSALAEIKDPTNE